ncbi:MAG: caspase family protein [Elusimicrobiota bacterium]
MIFRAVLFLILQVPVSAEYDRSYWDARYYDAKRAGRAYSLPPAIHYTHEEQWRRYKQQHEDEIRRTSAQAAQQSTPARPPASVYTSQTAESNPIQSPYLSGPPGRAEVTEFKDTFTEVVSRFVAAKSARGKGEFLVKDDRSGETLRLKLQHIHADRLRYHSTRRVSGCVNFETLAGPKREVDLDFELSKDWDWDVSRIFIHGINGRERYAYDANNIRAANRTAALARVPRPRAPAHLSADVRMGEPSGEESAGIVATVTNAGPGPAYSVRLHLEVNSAPTGVALPEDTLFGDLRPGQSEAKIVPVTVAEGAAGGAVRVVASVIEANGFDTEPVLVEFNAHPVLRPLLSVSAASVDGGVVKPGETARLSATIVNSGKAPALGAKAALRLGGKDMFMSGDSSVLLGDIAPGESKEAAFEFFVNRRVGGGVALPIFLSASDARDRHGFSELSLPVTMGQAAGPLRVMSIGGQRAPVAPPSVDMPPVARTPLDSQAFAVVIGIESYRDVPGVEFAARDAQSVYEYLVGSMGFKPENVVLLKNERAGHSDLATYLGPWLADRVSGTKSRVFIYYSGHGTVDPKTGNPSLVPYDGDPSYPETKGFPLKDLYASLGRWPGAETIVALDSCFSGLGGRSVVPHGLRPLIPVRDAAIPANVVVLAASGADQVSVSYPSGRHGLMTYYLLNGLGGAADANRDGKITTLELFGYLGPAVEAEARRRHVEQRPRLAPSPEVIGGRGSRVWIVR